MDDVTLSVYCVECIILLALLAGFCWKIYIFW